MKKWQRRSRYALCALILVVAGVVVVMSYDHAQHESLDRRRPQVFVSRRGFEPVSSLDLLRPW